MELKQFIRHFFLLFSGTAIAQIINFASYPILARLFLPADFGVFAMFVAATAIPSAIACGRFDLAVPTAPRHGRFAILWLCYLISILTGIVSAIAIWIYFVITNSIYAWWFVLMIGITVLLTGYVNATSIFLMRHERYRVTSESLVVRTGVTITLQIGLSFIWADSFSLVMGFFIGLAAQSIQLWFHVKNNIPLRSARILQIRIIFLRYRRQVSVDIPSTLLAAMALNITPFFIQYLYGANSVGLFSLAQRIAIVPLQLFNDSLAQVFFQKAARSHEKNGHFWNEFKLTIFSAGLVALVALICIGYFSKTFVILFLGNLWEPAAVMLVIVAPMLAVRSVTMSIATTVFVLKRPLWLLYHNISSIFLMCIAFGIAFFKKSNILEYLEISTWLLGIEFLIFGFILGVATFRQRNFSKNEIFK